MQNKIDPSSRIFIVDDNDLCREMISEIITNEGYSNLKSFSLPFMAIEAVRRGDHPSLLFPISTCLNSMVLFC